MLSKWQRDLGRKPSDREICHYLCISQEKLENIEKAAQMGKISSLDVPVGEDEDCNMYDLLPGSGNEEEAVLDKVQHEQLCAILWPMVDSLPGQQPEQKGLRELRRPNKSNQLRYFLTEQRSYSKALQGNGVGTFNRTWTSSTERVALWEEEYQAELEKLRAGV